MSTPLERTQSILWAESFLQRLSVMGTKNADEARQILAHFPTKFDLLRMSQQTPMIEFPLKPHPEKDTLES